MSAEVFDGVIFERAGSSYMARINGGDNLPVTQASITSIAYEVWQIGPDPEPPEFAEPMTPIKVKHGTLNVADVIFDALQTDSRWTVDATGYNFRVDLTQADFPALPVDGPLTSGWFRIEIEFTPVSGAAIPLVFKVEMLQRLMGKG